jgi:hypothetical protein
MHGLSFLPVSSRLSLRPLRVVFAKPGINPQGKNYKSPEILVPGKRAKKSDIKNDMRTITFSRLFFLIFIGPDKFLQALSESV